MSEHNLCNCCGCGDPEPLADTSPCYWWLSFVDRTGDPELGTVACNLGISIVFTGGDIGEAVEEAWQHDCNPGGEVLGVRLPDIRRPT